MNTGTPLLTNLDDLQRTTFQLNTAVDDRNWVRVSQLFQPAPVGPVATTLRPQQLIMAATRVPPVASASRLTVIAPSCVPTPTPDRRWGI